MIRVPWTQKPPPGTDLDRTNPLCPDYCWPFLSASGSVTPLWKNQPLIAPPEAQLLNIFSSLVPGQKYGLSRRRGSSSEVLWLGQGTAEVDKIFGTEGCTILIAHRHSSGNQGAIIGVDTGVSSEQLFVLLPWSDNTIQWWYGPTSIVSIPLGSVTLGDDLWVFSAGSRGLEMWQNGILVGANTATLVPRSFGGTLAKMPSWTAGDNFLADTALIMTWRRELPQSALRNLYINPWQVFQSKSYFFDTELAPSDSGAFNMPGVATVSFVGAEATSPSIQSGAFASSGLATVDWDGSFATVVTDVKIKLEDGTWFSLI